MNRIVAAVVAVFVSFSLFAQPCPSLQWTLGQGLTGFDFGVFVTETAAVDYDEDGKLDIVGVADYPHHRALVWWKGNGNLTFGTPTQILESFGFTNIVIADATGDGRADVLVGDLSAQALRILPGTGSGRGPMITSYLTTSPGMIFATNRDADPEVELYLSQSYLHIVAVYDHIATAIDEVGRLENLTGSPKGLAGADFDGDGHFDIAVGSNFDGQRVDVYFGNADESYDAPVSLPADDPWDLRVGDLDEDGLLDFVIGNVKTENVWPEGIVSVYMNEGSRNFTYSTLFVSKPGTRDSIRDVVLQDANGDGHLDLIVSGQSHTTTALGVGDGTFRSPTYLGAIVDQSNFPAAASSYALADFNGNGKLDLAMGAHRTIYPFTDSCTTQVDLHTVSPVISAGQDAKLHVQVSGFAADTPTPRGTITLRDGGTTLASATASADGKASFTISGLAVGDHPLTAEFSGNTAVPAATSIVVDQTVTNETTETIIELPDAPGVYGQAYPIQITIEGGGHDWVTVTLDGVQLDHYTANPLNLALEPGNHTISAKFLGTIYDPPSESETLLFSIAKAPSNIIGTSGALSVRNGSAHVLTYMVSGAETATPTGSLQLIEGTTTLGGGTLVNGAVTVNLTLTRGAHDVRVVYSGDSRHEASEQPITLEVLPDLPLVIEARGLPNGVHVAYLLPANTDLNSLALFRRQVGAPTWAQISWNADTGMDASVPVRGVVAYEYHLQVTLNNGTVLLSNTDSAMLFSDDQPLAGTLVKSKHFTELRTAVNLLRTQAKLAPFEFADSVGASAPIRASHIAGLRTALTQARTQLGMSTPAFTGAEVGTSILAAHVQEIRELAR